MEWLYGIAGGIIIAGMLIGAILGSIAILAIAGAAGVGLVLLGEEVRAAQEAHEEHKKRSNYPAYKY